MNNKKPKIIKRRDFITSVTGLAAGYVLVGSSTTLEGADQTRKVLAKLTAEEKEIVAKSRMAKDMSNYFGKGYSCAEAALVVTLRHFKLPEKWVWAAAAYGGGLGERDLCGFLTGGIMGLGFACGGLKTDKKAAKKLLSQVRKEYWQWWKTVAPLHCAEIRPKGSPRGICVRLGQLSAAKLEELSKKIKNA